ncbi:ribosome hibernation-promoting factor, HPF/YfiA family [Muriicola sp. Z0-33]|uniref:ribosome hibernation-promoting factor, HPF/YfiA family n=1 Tax=Muriicola sp. Z0-33 TaxID=2816957 RepID=UPI0022379818|nr:ribosome-associated translation inhibitor RaiA [Muriicola sp. Z0-33]MCW5515546.1 ribosome-associated translation inhibitor RaiA [Muriicola sp. Z0-33]
MTIQIQYLHMPESDSLNEIVSRHLDKLAKQYQFVIRSQVTFKLENSHDKVNKVCEIELSAPGPRLFAKSMEDNFEKAAAKTIDDLKRQLKKRKEKFSSH